MIFGFNFFDILVVAILAVYISNSMRVGLIKSLFGLVSVVISFLLSNKFYPVVANFIREHTKFFDWFNASLRDIINIRANLESYTGNLQTDVINKLELPSFISDKLISGNDFAMMKLFDINSIEKYIADNLSNILINVLAMVFTFTIISIGMGVISNILDIISYFPIIHGMNRLGGMVVGFIKGVLFVWLACLVLSLVVNNPKYKFIYDLLRSSSIAIQFYDNNLLFKFLIRFMPILR